MLYHNENDADGIQQVLTALHQYVPYYGDDANRVYSSQSVVADQLSVERGVNALFELSNGFTPEEQLEGLHLEIADWHAGNKFLKVRNIFRTAQIKSTPVLCCALFSVHINKSFCSKWLLWLQSIHVYVFFSIVICNILFLVPYLDYNSEVNFRIL